MTKLEVNPGVCGFCATITAEGSDEDGVKISIETQCAGCAKLVQELMKDGEADPFAIALTKAGTGPVYEIAATCCPHAACPVPSGIVKCVEVECHLALPRPVEMKFLD